MIIGIIIIALLIILIELLSRKNLLPGFGARIRIIAGDSLTYRSRSECDAFLSKIRSSIMNIYRGVNKNKTYEAEKYLDVFKSMHDELKRSYEGYSDQTVKHRLNITREIVALQNRDDADLKHLLNRSGNLVRADLDKLDISNNIYIPDTIIIDILTDIDVIIYMIRNSIRVYTIDLTSTKEMYKRYKLNRFDQSCIGYYSNGNPKYDVDSDIDYINGIGSKKNIKNGLQINTDTGKPLDIRAIRIDDDNYEKDMLGQIRSVKKNYSMTAGSMFTCDNNYSVENEEYLRDLPTPVYKNNNYDHKYGYSGGFKYKNTSQFIADLSRSNIIFEDSMETPVTTYNYSKIPRNINKYSISEDAPCDMRYEL